MTCVHFSRESNVKTASLTGFKAVAPRVGTGRRVGTTSAHAKLMNASGLGTREHAASTSRRRQQGNASLPFESRLTPGHVARTRLTLPTSHTQLDHGALPPGLSCHCAGTLGGGRLFAVASMASTYPRNSGGLCVFCALQPTSRMHDLNPLYV